MVWKNLFCVTLTHLAISAVIDILLRSLVLTRKAKKGKVLTILWCRLQFVYSKYKQLKRGSKSMAWRCFPYVAQTGPDLVLMCPFVMCPLCYSRVMPGHLWTMQNPVEPGRTMTWLHRKSNEPWNQYVQSRLTQGMLGNGVSGALCSYFNHKDLGLSTHKQAGCCQNNATPWVALYVCLWLLFP